LSELAPEPPGWTGGASRFLDCKASGGRYTSDTVLGMKGFGPMSDKKVHNLDELKELIELMVANDLVEVELANGENKVHLKRPQAQVAPAGFVQHMGMMPSVMPVHTGMAAMAAPAAAAAPAEDAGLIDIKSPIVGTFYSAPSPDSETYVKVGSDVNAETVVCIIEAMKVMNEIKAECTGTIVKIMAANGKAVEYGQVIFKVKPH
jgi:acetyl-CoA carboxylase biotin carboxyl carrier protein